jgi:hypothetical protein
MIVTTSRGVLVAVMITVSVGGGEVIGTAVVTGAIPDESVQPARKIPRTRIPIRTTALHFLFGIPPGYVRL